MTTRWQAIVLASASAFTGAACGSNAQSETELSDGQAMPVAGVTKPLHLPHGDTVTVPVDYSFKRKPGTDSLIGTLYDDQGRPVFELDACGLAGERIDEHEGTLDHAVNSPFYYGRHPESWPGLLVTYTERGPCNFTFDEHIDDEQALKLAHTYTARDNLHDLCNFDKP
ncbi:MAG TPA: hypothetical protein VHO25_07370 [Polyangiaceae bacterium]|nr:hypothetical protein [Polyangiaceae bacterium]